MLQFKQSDTEAFIIITLTEFVSLAEPSYLFVFTHVLTKEQVLFIKTDADDLSGYKSRYNKFTINPSELFQGKQPGEWHYIVYEQQSTTNTNLNLAGAILEQGKLLIDRATQFTYSKYESETTYKSYNG